MTAKHEWGGLGMTETGKNQWAEKLTLTLKDGVGGRFENWADEGVAQGFALHFRVQVSGFYAKAMMR